MSKRARQGEDIMTDGLGSLQTNKRFKYTPPKSDDDKKDAQSSGKKIGLSMNIMRDLECPICYDEYDGYIYQCKEGHVICEVCYQKVNKCPQCKCVLNKIRNRALENIIHAIRPNVHCYFKNEGCLYKAKRDTVFKHMNKCEYRRVKCPFNTCSWFNSFNKFIKHLQIKHQSCLSNHDTFNNNYDNNPKVLEFVHAIKFQKIEESDMKLIWPKVIFFGNNNPAVFVLTKYTSEYMSTIVRIIDLPSLTKSERIECQKYINNTGKINKENIDNNFVGMDMKPFKLNVFNDGRHESFGEYKVEIKMKNKVVLTWPSDLYSVLVPITHEKKQIELLKIPQKIVQKYWQQIDDENAVMMLHFTVSLK